MLDGRFTPSRNGRIPSTALAALLTVLATAAHASPPAFERLLPADRAPDEIVGLHPATSGTWIAAGGTRPDPEAPGALHLFTLLGDRFAHAQRLQAPTPQPGDVFGAASAFDRETLVVGAYGASVEGVRSGAAYVYRLEDGAWTHEATLSSPNPAELSGFGAHVAVSGDTIFVGEAWQGVVGGYGANRAIYEFRRRDGRWQPAGSLTPPSTLQVAEDWRKASEAKGYPRAPGFGGHFELDGDRLAVAAMGAGAVLLYERGATGWQLRQTLADPTGHDSAFARTVALQGDWLVVGALRANGAAADTGAAYVYRRVADRWELDQKLLAPHAGQLDMFGHWVALDAERILVGAFRYAGDGAQGSGAAFLFARTEDRWQLQQTLVPPAAAQRQFTAYAVALAAGVAVLSPGDELGAPPKAGAAPGGGVWAAQLPPSPKSTRPGTT